MFEWCEPLKYLVCEDQLCFVLSVLSFSVDDPSARSQIKWTRKLCNHERVCICFFSMEKIRSMGVELYSLNSRKK